MQLIVIFLWNALLQHRECCKHSWCEGLHGLQTSLYDAIVLQNRGLPTCAIKHGQQNGGNPCSVAISNAKFTDKFFKEDTNCLREGVGESRDDKTAKKDSPAPASVRGLNTRWTVISYYSSHGAAQVFPKKEKAIVIDRRWDIYLTQSNHLTKTGRNGATVKVTKRIWTFQIQFLKMQCNFNYSLFGFSPYKACKKYRKPRCVLSEHRLTALSESKLDCSQITVLQKNWSPYSGSGVYLTFINR